MHGQIEKKCNGCKRVKNIEYFYPKSKQKGYYHPYCKPCSQERARSYVTPESKAKWRQTSRELKPRYSATRRSAIKRHIEFQLTVEEYAKLTVDAVCHYCNGTLPETRGGLDRKDTHGPYSISNCVPCCVECNRIKGCALSYEEMILVAQVLIAVRRQVKEAA